MAKEEMRKQKKKKQINEIYQYIKTDISVNR